MILRSLVPYALALLLTVMPTMGGQVKAEEPAGTEPVIAVAASLRTAVEDVIAAYAKDGKGTIKASFGATGNFVRQIETGAPFELFLAADEKSVDKLEKGGFTSGAGEVLVVGKLALATPKTSGINVEAGMAGLDEALKAGKVNRIAIANPELAPYGKAAEAALSKANLLEAAKPKFVLGENVGQAAQYVASGSVEVAFIPVSLAVSEEIKANVNYAVLPAELHDPIKQKAAVLKNAGEAAKNFYAYLKSPAAKEIFETYGFAVP